jgi:hypothetical protein
VERAAEHLESEKELIDASFMLTSAKRRISILERSIELPMTAERFFAGVQERVRLTVASFEEAFQTLLRSLSDGNLDRLEKEQILRYGDLIPLNAAETAEERTPSD